MNANIQAQKSFKTFILALSISLMLFSGAYYLMSLNKGDVVDVKEQRGVVQEEPATLNSNDENKTMPVPKPDLNMRPITQGITEEEAGTSGESVFGSLSSEELDIGGPSVPADKVDKSSGAGSIPEAVAGESDISSIPGSTVSPENVMGASTKATSTSPVEKVVSTSPSTTVTTEVSEEEEVVAYLKDDVMGTVDKKIEDNKVAETPTPPPTPETNLEVVNTKDSTTKETDNTPGNTGGVEPPKAPATENRGVQNPKPQVLAGADQTTTPVPDTGSLRLTVGLIVSLIIFIIAILYIVKKPRRLALKGFEKDATKDNSTTSSIY
jgi:hypothetical protein